MKLIDKCEDEWTLGRVTARREKALKELGLTKEAADSTDEYGMDAVLEKILDESGDDLLKLINSLFDGREIKKEELEDLYKDEVKVAVFSFFMNDFKLIERLRNLIPTSTLPKLTMSKPENLGG